MQTLRMKGDLLVIAPCSIAKFLAKFHIFLCLDRAVVARDAEKVLKLREWLNTIAY